MRTYAHTRMHITQLGAWAEIILSTGSFNVALRSLKLFRFLKPLTSFVFFNGLEAIMRTIQVRT